MKDWARRGDDRAKLYELLHKQLNEIAWVKARDCDDPTRSWLKEWGTTANGYFWIRITDELAEELNDPNKYKLIGLTNSYLGLGFVKESRNSRTLLTPMRGRHLTSNDIAKLYGYTVCLIMDRNGYFSIEKLAELLNVSYDTVVKWTNGQRYMKPDTMFRFCELMNCEPGDLFTYYAMPPQFDIRYHLEYDHEEELRKIRARSKSVAMKKTKDLKDENNMILERSKANYLSYCSYYARSNADQARNKVYDFLRNNYMKNPEVASHCLSDFERCYKAIAEDLYIDHAEDFALGYQTKESINDLVIQEVWEKVIEYLPEAGEIFGKEVTC